jgi:SMI1 / KNR4 family (SUKH-1)
MVGLLQNSSLGRRAMTGSASLSPSCELAAHAMRLLRIQSAPIDLAPASDGVEGKAMSLIAELQQRAKAGVLATSMDPERCRLYSPATADQVARTEALLGFALPPLLRDLYMLVANGGFGPGYGLLGLEHGAPYYAGSKKLDIVALYQSFLHQPTRNEPWGEKLLPICHWGCTYYSYLDCSLPQAPVMAFDENSHGHGPWGCAFSLHAHSFEEWMQRWADGEDLWKSIALYGAPIMGYEENETL